MSNEWNDLVKEESPHEKARANAQLEKEAKKERYLEKEVPLIKNRAWNYEQKELNKMLGWEMMGEVYHGTHHKTGKEEYVMTSEKTFERREKVDITITYYEKMRLDKTKISDLQAFNELDKEAAEFFTQAREKLGAVAPVMFRNKDYVRYFFDGTKKSTLILVGLVVGFSVLFMGGLVGIISLLLFALLAVGGTVLSLQMYRKKMASFLPLIEAYHNKVKEFEERAKQLTLS